MQRLFATRKSWAPTVLRLVLGLIFAAHGAQKLFGWFGGFGYSGTMQHFTGTLNLPYIIGLAVILTEFVGGILLIGGFLSRIWAAGIIGIMLGAIFTTHLQYGFFMNWTGQKAGEGFEFHILAIAAAAAVVILGSGVASIDRWITRRSDLTEEPVPVRSDRFKNRVPSADRDSRRPARTRQPAEPVHKE